MTAGAMAALIDKVQRGERVRTDTSLFPPNEVKPAGYVCPGHYDRTIACDGDTDIVECSDCGRQRVTPCNFDDEYD